MEEPKSKDETQKTPGIEAAKHSAAELGRVQAEITEQTKESAHSPLAIFSAYILLVGVVISGGVLAYYSGHKNTMEIIFYISIPLLLLIPAMLVGYFAFHIHQRHPFLKNTASFFLRHTKLISNVCALIGLCEMVRAVWEFNTFPRAHIAEILMSLFLLLNWIFLRIIFRIDRLYNLIDLMNGQTGHLIEQMGDVIKILDVLIDTRPPSKSE